MNKEQAKQEEAIFDLRTIDRRISRGEVDSKDFEAFLKKLPNDESRGEFIEVFEESPADEPTPHADELSFTSA